MGEFLTVSPPAPSSHRAPYDARLAAQACLERPGMARHLHAVLGKCGSTTLQAYLAAHRGALLSQGVDYPDPGSGDAGNMTPYALSQRPAAARKGRTDIETDPDTDPSCGTTSDRIRALPAFSSFCRDLRPPMPS